ncbi:hypothetical protein Fcan01_03280 [Folsomia candida]|uniref:F-box domain-containing protein n=1 Tax=Folsomia candida TaxID=158441 RepID=A0A226EZK7_FOLCA|nr:hypothetical protein Fcan01_03280 [Folsomia candida]
MGVNLSTPNFNPRDDQLLLPNEILYNIASNLSPRDVFWAQRVCRSWFLFGLTDSERFLGDAFGINCQGSEDRLHQLALHYQRNEQEAQGINAEDETHNYPLPLRTAAFFLENLELTRNPLSLKFWSLFSDTITRLEFTDCAVLPRICVDVKDNDGNVVNVDTNFSLGCPNLKKLALRNMDKSFMMGAQFIQFHQILHLSNLVSLDVSCNKNITDKILLNLLLKTEKLESLNLMGCPLVLARAVHNRFYPQALNSEESGPVEFSDHIFSFETIVKHFLTRPKGAHMNELILKATPLTSYTLELIRDPAIFTWESLDLSYCRELKKDAIHSVLSAHSQSLKKLSLKSDGRGLMVLDVLKEISLPNLESLSIRNGKFDRGAVSVFETMPKLRKLSCANPFRSPVVVGSLMQIQQQVFSKLKNITHLSLAHSNEFVNNGLLQVIILNMKQIKKLHLPGCESLSDFGLTGIVSQPEERNLEEGDPNIRLPLWLLSPGGGGSGPKRTVELESEFDSLIDEGRYPKELGPGLYNSRRNSTGCLSDLKFVAEQLGCHL